MSGDLWQAGTDGDLLLANSLVWASLPSWLTVEPNADTIPSGGSTDIAVTFRAAGLPGGSYGAQIVFSTNDPLAPEVTVPLHFEVVEAVLGDFNADGVVTGSDIIYLVNFVFKGGPEPIGQMGDVSCDHAVTIADIITTVNFVFRSGACVPCP